ncbi:hypothetical protein [Octadecabacter ascidiaceicola]|uniref:Uncharacterized protein n=1 Tax=Octadecabacter ascidiaceicola TaxID=1655543 RepID=A0A238JJX4_9RHOB|nr:hypothetical protein [Octadecabacter ascidiaceicola]SMX30978.1 hypothetical protein OCA8868_00127 [Octadecabacter ascidiaceicola]
MREADHILIPLLDETFALAQVARIEWGRTRIMILISDRSSARTTKAKAIPADAIVAAAIVSSDAVQPEQWPVIGYDAVPRIAGYHDLYLAGEDPIAPAIVEAFATALHGLYPWDGFPDPDFFTNMLRDPEVLPAKARMTSDFPKPESP